MTITQPITTAGPLPGSWIESERALAEHYAPRLRFDRREPFLPLAAGYTLFYGNTFSPSFPRQIVLPPSAACAIEYAIWWDWDIQHLYELEHLWVYLDGNGEIVRAEGSWHGVYRPLWDERHNCLPLEAGKLVAYAEPGKHAFAPSSRRLLDRAQITRWACGLRAGRKGVHLSPLFAADLIPLRTPFNNALVGDYLRRRAFRPTYDFSAVVDLASVTLVPWSDLAGWIPQRVAWWVNTLAQQHPTRRAVPEAISSPFPAAGLFENW